MFTFSCLKKPLFTALPVTLHDPSVTGPGGIGPRRESASVPRL